MDMQTSYDERIERQARRRAGMKMGWYIHAAVYVLVNLFLAAISLGNGGTWFMYPALGWGLGLAIHGIVTFFIVGGNMQARLVERERRKLRDEQGPW